MISVIQRVLEARVTVGGRTVGEIGPGLLALVAVERGDQPANAEGRMNRSLADTGGGLLLVSQFTLAADTAKGTRASFTPAAPPDEAERLFNEVVALARSRHPMVATGEFGAEMTVSLVNHGPVTFRLTA